MENNSFSSRIPDFYKQTIEDRQEQLMLLGVLNREQIAKLNSTGLTNNDVDNMIENAIGVFGMPMGLGLNFLINGRDVLVPMVIEEPSVIAGASYMAKMARANGGFTASSTPPEMIGQVQVLDIPDIDVASEKIYNHRESILQKANESDPILLQLGGGARDIEVRVIEDSPIGAFLVVHLVYDVRDAMGANAVNTACEIIAPMIEEITEGRVHLRILSNLADRRITKATCSIPTDTLAFGTYTGEQVRDGIIEAWAFAAADPYRAATHNKGIMNGVDAVVIATGNDWRAVEAGAHAYAANSGKYTSLSTWGVDEEGNLAGSLEMPMAVGIVGGATRVHPVAKISLHIMDLQSASDLAEVIVSVGLAQNLAALRALATEGIQHGHMRLHARQVALAAGALGDEISEVVKHLIEVGVIRIDEAEKHLLELREDM